MKLKKDKYQAQGFVEALLAIIIAGIASIVFMTIAAKTIGQVAKNEYVDQLTQEAVRGSAILKYVTEEWNFNRRDVITSDFLSPTTGFINSLGNCYSLDGDVNNIRMSTSEVCVMDPSGDGINPSVCARDSIWEEVRIENPKIPALDDNIFRIACVDSTSDQLQNIMVVKIYTGFRGCNRINQVIRSYSDADSSCDLYEYVNVFKLEPVQ